MRICPKAAKAAGTLDPMCARCTATPMTRSKAAGAATAAAAAAAARNGPHEAAAAAGRTPAASSD